MFILENDYEKIKEAEIQMTRSFVDMNINQISKIIKRKRMFGFKSYSVSEIINEVNSALDYRDWVVINKNAGRIISSSLNLLFKEHDNTVEQYSIDK